tara:strand:+ start:63 stop:419 length:357 start_codon:yes stop_codon:yes gene_type:complete
MSSCPELKLLHKVAKILQQNIRVNMEISKIILDKIDEIHKIEKPNEKQSNSQYTDAAITSESDTESEGNQGDTEDNATKATPVKDIPLDNGVRHPTANIDQNFYMSQYSSHRKKGKYY